ncbi:Cyclic nucleotide-binding domain protein [uncultured archaeon]|nr:Cyclic nucleotide-binding domain protein [uncultured archaeon]
MEKRPARVIRPGGQSAAEAPMKAPAQKERKAQIEDLMRSAKDTDSRFKAPNCQWCPASKSKCYYSELSDDVKPLWLALRKHIKYKDGHEIFSQGTISISVYIVCKGQAGIIRMDEDGHELLAHIAEQGELVGDRAFCAGGDYKESAIVIGRETMISHIRAAAFDQLLDIEPRLVRLLLKVRSKELGSAEKRAVALAFMSISDRVEEVLAKKSKDLRFPYTRDRLASMVGVAPETLSRTLKPMEAKGLIRRSEKDITLTQRFVEQYNRKMEERGKKRRLGAERNPK